MALVAMLHAGEYSYSFSDQEYVDPIPAPHRLHASQSSATMSDVGRTPGDTESVIQFSCTGDTLAAPRYQLYYSSSCYTRRYEDTSRLVTPEAGLGGLNGLARRLLR